MEKHRDPNRGDCDPVSRREINPPAFTNSWRNTETRTEGIATLDQHLPGIGLPHARRRRNTETRTEGIATVHLYDAVARVVLLLVRRNTETRTEGIATRLSPGPRSRRPTHAEEKHRDPNRGDCDPFRDFWAFHQASSASGETPRPEPRGLRPQRALRRSRCVRGLPQGETPRPEPRGLRLQDHGRSPPLSQVFAGRNTETRTEGIATWPWIVEVRSPSGGRNTETRTEGIATLWSSGRYLPANPESQPEKHRDPNRGDCDLSNVNRISYHLLSLLEKHRDPNGGDCDQLDTIPMANSSSTENGETPRPEPRGLRPSLSPWPVTAAAPSSWGETPRPEPRGLRLGTLSENEAQDPHQK